jgi:hypothetical protein
MSRSGETLLARLRELRKQFDVAYEEGLAALDAGDFQKLGAAIRQEGRIIDEQKRLFEFFVSADWSDQRTLGSKKRA